MAAKKNEIIRTPDFVGGGITPEEEVLLKEHTAKWIAIAKRTDNIDVPVITEAIKNLYIAAELTPPRVVVVPSPQIMAVAGGFAAAILYTRGEGKKVELPKYETMTSSSVAEAEAIRAIYEALGEAPEGSTYTLGSQKELPFCPSTVSWARPLAMRLVGNKAMAATMIDCAKNWHAPYQGGNMWAAWPAYLSAFRDILGLNIPEGDKFAAWEKCAIEGGYRWMHADFCIVSDFPETLATDAQNRPHSDTGPSHRWRDGWAFYHVHNVRVPEYVIERPHEITVKDIDSETNAEVRRVKMEKYGYGRYLLDSGAEELSRDEFGILYRKNIPDDEPVVMVRVLNSTSEPDGVHSREEAIKIFGPGARHAVKAPADSRWKEYMLRVDPQCRPLPRGNWPDDKKREFTRSQQPQALTPRNAVASTFGLRGEEYDPEFES